MATDRIVVRRGLLADLPQHALSGEFLFAEDVGRLFMGRGDNLAVLEVTNSVTSLASGKITVDKTITGYDNLEETLDQLTKVIVGITGSTSWSTVPTSSLTTINDTIASTVTNQLATVQQKIDSVTTQVNTTIAQQISAVQATVDSKTTRPQKTKLGVTASASAPVVTEFTLDDNTMSKFPSVLKLTSGATQNDQVMTLCEFNNGDQSSFIYTGEEVVFDGKMRLNPVKTVTLAMTSEGAIGDGYLYSVAITNLDDFNTIETIELV